MERFKKGTIKVKVLLDKDLYEGLNVAVFNPDKGYLEVSKLSHLIKDQWITDKGTLVLYGYELHQLYVYTDNENPAIVNVNQWYTCLNKLDINSEREIEYLFTPMRFKEGIFMMECTECAAHYMASKSQGLCRDCCDMYGTAKILSSKNDTNAGGKTKKLIFTTEKTLTIAQAKDLAYHAFNTGRLSTIDYDSWILTQNL